MKKKEAIQNIEADDQLFENSERPYSSALRTKIENSTWVDTYLRPRFVIPSVIISIGILYFLYWLGVFQVITVVVVAAFLLILSLLVISYLDHSLDKHANILAQITIKDWHQIKELLAQKNNQNQEDNFWEGEGSPFLGDSNGLQSLEEVKAQIVDNQLNNLKIHIEGHLENQRRNGNIHLTLSMVLGLIAVFVLISMTIQNNVANSFLTMFCIGGVLIGGISIQFLFQYKNTQDRIKFFQNELTNLQARITAFQLSYMLDNKELLAEIIREISLTERNFRMTKNDRLP